MRRRHGRLIALALGGALAALAGTSDRAARAQDEAAPACAAPTFRAQLMTPLAGRTPRDAGVVVGLFPGGSLRALPPLRLNRRRRDIPVRTEAIAPGLYRVTPDTQRVYGRWTLSGVAGDPELLFARARIPAPPARPALERVERYRVASGGESRTEVKAHFGFPTPNGVVAVLAYFGDDDTPDLFVRGVPQRTDAVLWSSSGRCPALPEGASPPPEQGPVRVAFVDLYGQVSQLSDPQSL